MAPAGPRGSRRRYAPPHHEGLMIATLYLITDPQTHAAVKRVADRLRSGGAVEEEVGDPALGDAEADAAAIFEPALVADRRHDGAIAGDGCDDAGMAGEGLHPAAIEVGFDVRSEQMRP